MKQGAASNFYFIEPMMALRVPDLPVGNWIYELKFDGYRALAFKAGKEVRLVSRNRTNFNNEKHYGTLATHWWLSAGHLIQPAPVTLVPVDCVRLGIICRKTDATTALRSYRNFGVWRMCSDSRLDSSIFRGNCTQRLVRLRC